MSEKPQYLTEQHYLTCNKGTMPKKVKVTSQSFVKVGGTKVATVADKQADNNFICLGSVAFIAGVAAGVCACIPGPGWVVAVAIVAVVAIAAGVGYFKCKAAGETRLWMEETVAKNTKIKGKSALLISSCMTCPAEGGTVTASETIWEAWGTQALTNLGHLAEFAFGFLVGRGAGGIALEGAGAYGTATAAGSATSSALSTAARTVGRSFINTAKTELITQFNPLGGWKGRGWFCNALRGVGLFGAYKQHWDIWTDDEKSLLDKLQASSVGLILDVFAAKGMTYLCFPAGTKVHTEWGLANIESLEEGIKVLTYNEQTGKQEYKAILMTTRRTTPKMCVLELSNGETLRVTPEHRFFNNGKWTTIEEFEIGDLLQTKEDIYLVIENKTIITTLVEVFNLEVEDNENYFVTIDGVLVHNGYKPRKPSDTNKNIDHSKTVNHTDGRTTYTDINGNEVTYNKDGYPDFSKYSIDSQQVKGMNGNYNHDAALANAQAGYSQTPDGYVWHHVEDGKTMQLVPKDINNKFPHTGGASGLKDGTLP